MPLFHSACYLYTVVILFFILCVVVQCTYALGYIGYTRQIPATITPLQRPPVSVVICAKDEAENLLRNLPGVLEQTYADNTGTTMYEVIVVNDNSSDNTSEVLQQLQLQYPHLRYINIQEGEGKKNALRAGVTLAKNNLLLLTDADCSPAGNLWLQLMTAPLSDGKEIVAGYGGYYPAHGLLNAFIRWETVHTFMQYSSYAIAGIPYMAVGRNLACTKSILTHAMQHPLWLALPSGDDDLLMRIAATATNTAVVRQPQAFTMSPAKTTWSAWLLQKQRHMSTGKYYTGKVKLLLGSYAATHAGAWLLFIFLLLTPLWQLSLILFTARWLVAFVAWRIAAVRVQEKISIYAYLSADIGWMIYNFALLPYITWKNKKNWK